MNISKLVLSHIQTTWTTTENSLADHELFSKEQTAIDDLYHTYEEADIDSFIEVHNLQAVSVDCIVRLLVSFKVL